MSLIGFRTFHFLLFLYGFFLFVSFSFVSFLFSLFCFLFFFFRFIFLRFFSLFSFRFFSLFFFFVFFLRFSVYRYPLYIDRWLLLANIHIKFSIVKVKRKYVFSMCGNGLLIHINPIAATSVKEIKWGGMTDVRIHTDERLLLDLYSTYTNFVKQNICTTLNLFQLFKIQITILISTYNNPKCGQIKRTPNNILNW